MDVPKYWLFQAIHYDYDITSAIWDLEYRTYGGDWWEMTRYINDVRVGDYVLIWRSGPDAGIVGVGKICTTPIFGPMQDTIYVTEKSRQKIVGKRGYMVRILYSPLLTENELTPILKNALKEDGFSDLPVIKMPRSTNHKLDELMWNKLLVKYPIIKRAIVEMENNDRLRR